MASILERRSAIPKWPLAMVVFGYLLASPMYADVAIVTGKATPVDAIGEPQARALWLGTLERVDGAKLVISDRSDGAIRDEFYHRVLRKTRGQVKAIRAIRAFQRGVAPPPELPGDESVLRWIGAQENRLGYVDAASVDDTVKVLLLIKVSERNEQP